MVKKKKHKRKSKDGLVSKVLRISPKRILEDEEGKYIPICSYGWHIGIIKDINVCETRKCKYYQKYRLESKDWGNPIIRGAKKYYDKFF